MSDLRPAYILVAEDNSTNQMIITAHLNALGMKYKVAKNGVEALKALSEDKFDLILMDCLMPEMDGFEATRKIRAQETATNTHIPIIALTASVSEEDQLKFKECGMDAFVAKPLQRELLVKSLQIHLKSA